MTTAVCIFTQIIDALSSISQKTHKIINMYNQLATVTLIISQLAILTHLYVVILVQFSMMSTTAGKHFK